MEESGMRRREGMRPLTCIQVEEVGPISLTPAGSCAETRSQHGVYTSDTGKCTRVVLEEYFQFV